MRIPLGDHPARGRASEQKTPKHDAHSHRRTSMEFGAVNLEIRRLGKQVRAKRQRDMDAGHTRTVTVGRAPGFKRERAATRR